MDGELITQREVVVQIWKGGQVLRRAVYNKG